MAESDYTPLKLRAADLKDLSVVAAMVQDALAPIGDIAFLADENRFVMALNRFRWEAEDDRGGADGVPHERVHAGLRFDNVKSVQYRNIDLRDRGRYLELLTIACDEGRVVLHFAEGAAIRLEVDALACALGDLDEPWPTPWKPEHETD
jgi:hypothetical protein